MRRKNHHENKSTHSHFGYLTSTYNQITVLSERVLLVKVKDPGPLIGDIFRSPHSSNVVFKRIMSAYNFRHAVVSLFYGSIFFQLHGGTDPTAYTERFGLQFFSILFMVMGKEMIRIFDFIIIMLVRPPNSNSKVVGRSSSILPRERGLCLWYLRLLGFGLDRHGLFTNYILLWCYCYILTGCKREKNTSNE